MGVFTKYRVTFQPLISVSENTYGDPVDVTDYIDARGVKSIKRSIDSGDYQIGVYTYGDITIKGYNVDGIFNDADDSRSIFIGGRDRCKVTVEYLQIDDQFGDEATSITFKGLINEEASRVSAVEDSITFKVLSFDSVIRNVKVPAGRVSSGSTISTAITNILTNPKITSVLNVSALNINPDLDITIDDGAYFTNLPARDAINELLLASNSVLVIDSSDNVIVKSRVEDFDRPFLELFGKSDVFGRENIVGIKDYNTGRHRTFTSVKINGQESNNFGLGVDFGERQYSQNLEWITSDVTSLSVAEKLLDEFKAPKIELKVDVSTKIAKNYELLDLVSINYPLRVKPAGKFLPVFNVTKFDDVDEPFPFEFGSLKIDSNIAFKIIEFKENPSTFITTLKLRQIGTTFSDGLFSEAPIALFDFARFDESIFADGATGSVYSAVYGAAVYDDTTYD